VRHFETAIIGGIVIDGTGGPRYRADIGIAAGRVAQIGTIAPDAADRVLDAEGLIVAPGFIDLHTHYDAQLFWDPYCTMSGWHGVTSVVIGNCGFGFAPVPAEHRERAMRSMTRVEAIPFDSMAAGMPWDWETFPEFLDSLERTPKGLNVLPYVPAGPLIAWVLGYERAKAGVLPSDAEHGEMQRLLHQAMDAGACGWSAQRLVPEGPASTQRDFDGTPMITDVMHDATCNALAEVLRDRNEGFIQMTMISGDPKRDAECYESMARISGRPVLYNVVQAFDDRPEIHRGALRWLQRCRERGLRVYGQGLTTDAGYTFTFEDWNLFDDAEPWREATLGTVEERLAKLADPGRRPALRAERPRTATEPIEKITVLGPRTPETERFREWTIAEVAADRGVDPVDALLDIAVADGLKTLFFVRNNNNSIEYLREIVDDPYVTFGVSDGGAHTKFLTAGRYPTETIVKVVREHQMCSLEHAHWRLSAFPAWCAGFADRGVIAIGSPADLVVYDFDRLEVCPPETVTDLPGGEWRRIQRATGYRWTLVNGAVTFADGESTGETPGVLLRHGHA
jgi:N-acyl-D-aspartate/D-glutamate deacylase